MTEKPITTTITTTTTTTPKPAETTTEKIPEPTTTESPISSCIDKLEICETWSKPNKYCTNEGGCCKVSEYISYMSDSCTKSCGLC